MVTNKFVGCKVKLTSSLSGVSYLVVVGFCYYQVSARRVDIMIIALLLLVALVVEGQNESPANPVKAAEQLAETVAAPIDGELEEDLGSEDYRLMDQSGVRHDEDISGKKPPVQSCCHSF